mmetsp:Transcript_9909/g.24689  ORF Transcript_9909/g.24689 Transcript_9909/m.24689 type:complete len:545 (-) Transcript_9909:49-1683(-)
MWGVPLSSYFLPLLKTEEIGGGHMDGHLRSCVGLERLGRRISSVPRSLGCEERLRHISHLFFGKLVVVVLYSRVLVLLVLSDEVILVGLGLGELHLIHSLAGVPVQEGLPPEHDAELVGNSSEDVLHGSRVADEGGREIRLWDLGRDVANRGLDVVWNPLDEVSGVLVLHLEHLILDILGRHLAPEEGRGGQVPSVPGVCRSHHVPSLEDLLREVANRDPPVGGGGGRSQRGEADLEEVQAWERDEVHAELSQVGVQLPREPQAAGHTCHHTAHQIVQVAERWVGHLECLVADVVQGLVVDHHDLVRVLDQLVDGQGGVVGLHDDVGHLWGREDWVGDHDAVRVLLPQLGEQKRAHAGPGAASDGVAELKTLQAVAVLDLLPRDIEGLVDELRTLGVVALGPVVSRTRGAADRRVRLEEAADAGGVDLVQHGGLQVEHDRPRDISRAIGFREVDTNVLLQHVCLALLDDIVLVENTVRAYFMLGRDDLPELGTNLVSGLAGLQVNDLAHGCSSTGGAALKKKTAAGSNLARFGLRSCVRCRQRA